VTDRRTAETVGGQPSGKSPVTTKEASAIFVMMENTQGHRKPSQSSYKMQIRKRVTHD